MRFLLAALILASTGALAQEPSPQTPDLPPGNPQLAGMVERVADQVTLREYLKGLIDERDVRYEQRFQAQQEALREALASSKERIANELRVSIQKDISEQAVTFQNKAEATLRFNILSEKATDNANAIALLDNRIVQLTSERTGVDTTVQYAGFLLAAVVAVVSIIGYFRRTPVETSRKP